MARRGGAFASRRGNHYICICPSLGRD
jgi:hypothetical protein